MNSYSPTNELLAKWLEKDYIDDVPDLPEMDAELSRVFEEMSASKELIDDVRILSMNPNTETGSFDMSFAGDLLVIIAAHLHAMFVEQGGVNYVEWHFTPKQATGDRFAIVMQRQAGITPPQRVTQLTNDLTAWLKEWIGSLPKAAQLEFVELLKKQPRPPQNQAVTNQEEK